MLERVLEESDVGDGWKVRVKEGLGKEGLLYGGTRGRTL